MVAFRRGVPITTETPTVVVDAGLPAGTHRFELVVADAAGNVSWPVQVSVTVSGLSVPTIPTGPTVPVRPPIAGPTVPIVGPIRPSARRLPRSPR